MNPTDPNSPRIGRRTIGADPWEATPRMLYEDCDGHPATALEVYALDLPNGVREWLCKSCWTRRWVAVGRPTQGVSA